LLFSAPLLSQQIKLDFQVQLDTSDLHSARLRADKVNANDLEESSKGMCQCEFEFNDYDF